VNESKVNVRLEVSDTGIGIRKDDISKIFRRFEQANHAVGNVYGGTGLGLTIVKMIVEGQGGTLKVRKALDRRSSSSFRTGKQSSIPFSRPPLLARLPTSGYWSSTTTL
jgi:signal transduction histidine kinase